MTSRDRIELSEDQRRELIGVVRAGRSEQRLALRARIVLHAARGHPTTVIASALGVCEDTVRKWRHRWCLTPGLTSLGDAERSGRPPVFSPVQIAEVKALACQPPAASGLPLSRWSCPDLASHVISGGICQTISPSTVRRWLRQDALKPWQCQSWIFIRDPDFAAKAERVLDLYARQWDGKPLGDNDFVISADEKTSIQARCRCHPSLPAGKSRMMRVSHDYHRRGALAYLAAYDVHRAKVFGRCQDSTGIVPFTALVEQVMTRQRLLPPRRQSHRPACRAISERDHGAHPGPRLLGQPGGDLLLDHRPQGALSERLHRPRRGRATTDRLRVPLQPSSPAIPVEVHHHRPRRPPGTTRPARTKINPKHASNRDRRLSPYELTNLTT